MPCLGSNTPGESNENRPTDNRKVRWGSDGRHPQVLNSIRNQKPNRWRSENIMLRRIVGWVKMIGGRVQWLVLVNTADKFRFPLHPGGEFLGQITDYQIFNKSLHCDSFYLDKRLLYLNKRGRLVYIIIPHPVVASFLTPQPSWTLYITTNWTLKLHSAFSEQSVTSIQEATKREKESDAQFYKQGRWCYCN
jgi:hypothetical protein